MMPRRRSQAHAGAATHGAGHIKLTLAWRSPRTRLAIRLQPDHPWNAGQGRRRRPSLRATLRSQPRHSPKSTLAAVPDGHHSADCELCPSRSSATCREAVARVSQPITSASAPHDRAAAFRRCGRAGENNTVRRRAADATRKAGHHIAYAARLLGPCKTARQRSAATYILLVDVCETTYVYLII